ncbi:MAG TPA: HAD family phosphatase [Chitinophagaceae bacterium]|nr:HAD family phosphatase [Chitinophagaceae bacterium]
MKIEADMHDVEAFLFDLNGTMIHDMPYHITAWHRILNRFGANISMEKMKEECYGKNHELIDRILPGRFTEEEMTAMSLEKELTYQQEFKPNLKLIDGLEDFIVESYRQGIKLAIGSAAIMSNIDFVLDGLGIRKYFDAIVSADDVSRSKPDPETWLKCAEILHLHPSECLVFEDTPKGAESAMNAGMKCIIITNLHKKEDFRSYNNVIGYINDFNEISVPARV